jgi:hypothetical protein
LKSKQQETSRASEHPVVAILGVLSRINDALPFMFYDLRLEKSERKEKN